MTKLIKDIRQTFIPGKPGRAGSSGSPYVPARTVYERQTVCSWYDLTRRPDGSIWRFGVLSYDVYGVPTYGSVMLLPPGSTVAGYPTRQYLCLETVVRRDYPAQAAVAPIPAIPAIPAQTLQDFNLGWNGRAQSIQTLQGDGSFRFQITPSSVGAVLGLCLSPVSTGFADILFGFHASSGALRIYEAGVEVTFLGAFTAETELEIRRFEGDIIYLVDGSQVWSSPAVAGDFVLASCLYSGGDQVFDAALVFESSAALSLRPMVAFGTDPDYEGADAELLMEPMTVSAAGGVSAIGAMAMEPLEVFAANYAYAYGTPEALPMLVAGESLGEPPAYALALVNMVPMSTGGVVLTGSFGDAALSLRIMQVLGYEAELFGDGRLTMEPMQLFADSLEPAGEVTLLSSLVIASNLDAAAIGDVLFGSSMVIGWELDGELGAEVLFESRLVIDDDFTVDSILEVLFSSSAVIRSWLSGDALMTAWVLNAATAGTTRYENFNFNSFAKIGDRYFGMKDDGLYELAGPTDAGALVNAFVNLGKSDFGTSMLKGLTDCYVGVSSTGAMLLKVVANGQSYTYTARASNENLQTQRVDLGRGLRSNFYELELQNFEGGDFELSSIEFTPIPLTRRI